MHIVRDPPTETICGSVEEIDALLMAITMAGWTDHMERYTSHIHPLRTMIIFDAGLVPIDAVALWDNIRQLAVRMGAEFYDRKPVG